jgi:hypothetical protein
MMPGMDRLLHLPTWLTVAAIIALMLSAVATGSFIRAAIKFFKLDVPFLISQHPLRIVEELHPGHRATWIVGGVMLTSKVTGRAKTEIPTSTVRALLVKRSDLLSRLSVQFCRQLATPVEQADRQARS